MASPAHRSLALLLISLLVAACGRQSAAPIPDGPCWDGSRRCAAAAAAVERQTPDATLLRERPYRCRNRESGWADICFDTALGQRNRGHQGQRP